MCRPTGRSKLVGFVSIKVEDVDRSYGKTHKHHPSTQGTELVALYMKLLVSPLYKVWTWKSKVKPGLKLNPALTFRLPFRADLEVRMQQCLCAVVLLDDDEVTPPAVNHSDKRIETATVIQSHPISRRRTNIRT